MKQINFRRSLKKQQLIESQQSLKLIEYWIAGKFLGCKTFPD